MAWVQAAVGADKHPDLIAALPDLLPRTGALYLLAYLALVALWLALGRPDRPGPLGRRLQRAARASRPVLQPAHIAVALPLVAIGLVLVISSMRPTFNSRYMLPLLPFGLVTMTAALWRPARPWVRAALIAPLLATQAVSLAAQQEAYWSLKPDYRAALEYASRRGLPVTGTALWELENLSLYYAGRREIAPLRIVSRADSTHLGEVIVFVPRAYPLDTPHLAELRERVRLFSRRAVAFPGLTLYELGPAPGRAGAPEGGSRP